MEFTAVLRRNATGNGYEFDEAFVNDFMSAWNYCKTYPDQYLSTTFATSSEREYWIGKAKAYGKSLSEPVEVRRIKNTDSSNPEHGKLCFVMEAKAIADERRRRTYQANLDREKRREAGEPIRRGRRLHAT